MAQAGLTARLTRRAGAKAEHSEPTVRIRRGRRLTDKSYSGDNRLVPPKSSYRRRSSAPRCRLILSWGWRSSQGFGCSPIKKIRELGSDRSGRESLIIMNHGMDSLNHERFLFMKKDRINQITAVSDGNARVPSWLISVKSL